MMKICWRDCEFLMINIYVLYILRFSNANSKDLFQYHFSDVDSEDDVPTKDLKENRPLQDRSNLPTISTEISKETSCHLPIYKQDRLFRVPLAVNNQIPVRNGKNQIGKDKIKKDNMSSSTKQNINVGNITKENIYEMDTYSDLELGYTAEVPIGKKNAGKKSKKQIKKPRVNRTGKIF